MVFDAVTVKTERIKEDADHEGVRVRFVGLLGRARVAMQIDVGFGDVVTPGAKPIMVANAQLAVRHALSAEIARVRENATLARAMLCVLAW